MHMIFFIILPYFHLKIKNDLTDKNIFYIKDFWLGLQHQTKAGAGREKAEQWIPPHGSLTSWLSDRTGSPGERTINLAKLFHI